MQQASSKPVSSSTLAHVPTPVPAPVPAQEDFLLMDMSLEERQVVAPTNTEGGSSTSIFDPLLGAVTNSGGRTTASGTAGGTLLNPDLADLSWGYSPAAESSESREVEEQSSSFEFIHQSYEENDSLTVHGHREGGATVLQSKEEPEQQNDVWDMGSALIDLNAIAPATGVASTSPASVVKHWTPLSPPPPPP